MKRSRYIKPDYALTFGNDDVIFLDISIIITENFSTENGNTYSMEIEKCQLGSQMEFARFVINTFLAKCPAAAITDISDALRELLRKDIETSLYALFYAGDIIT